MCRISLFLAISGCALSGMETTTGQPAGPHTPITTT